MHDGARIARLLGRGALLVKLDLKNAYRNVPVHPDDRMLLRVQWKGQVYVDSALPFGLHSAPKIFTALVDGLSWAFQKEGIVHTIHYLDDFLFIGAPGSPQCAASLSKALEICATLGVPETSNKIDGPTTQLSFLGIEMDTLSFQLRLPVAKLSALKSLIAQWQTKRRCSKRDLQSLLGHLNHAASVIGPGRTVLRGLIDLLPSMAAPHHRVRLNAQARADIQWWGIFMEHWNGVSFLPASVPTHYFYSDASVSWGCGAVWAPVWFQLQWPADWMEMNIAVKELISIVAATALWGLLRCLFFFTAHFRCSVSAEHIKGSQNVIADAISRNLPFPQPILPELHQIILEKSLSWSSQRWRVLFNSYLERV